MEPDTQPLREMDIEEFVRRIHADSRAGKHFALFLGAGCSVSSGIPAAGDLVLRHWLPRLRDLKAPGRPDIDVWASEAIPDYDPEYAAGSYGAVIDQLFLTQEDRQREIENLCEGRTPGFGYAVLAQLVALPGGCFNVVLTTNFDDLVADALYLFTDARPLVIHHESLAAYIRPTRTRPLVVKLHGDHRLSPRNTVLETATLEQEVQRHTAMVLHDRGLVFMGYGGADAGILKLLNELPPRALPFGAYWIHPEAPQGAIREWLCSRNGVWVRSGWFDEVMLLLRNQFDLAHPSPQRFNDIFKQYNEDFRRLSKAIDDKPTDEANAEALKRAVTETEAQLPDYWRPIAEAFRLHQTDPERADRIYREAIDKFPNAAPLLGHYAIFLADIRKNHDAAAEIYSRALDADPENAITLCNYANLLTTIRNDHAAEAMYQRALEINPQDANNCANFARLLLAAGRPEGLDMLARAIVAMPHSGMPMTALECEFYRFAHTPPQERADALRKLRTLVEQGIRSPGWDLSRNVERAVQDGHPEAAWLPKLAAVINGDAQPEVLSEWPAWQSAA